VSWIEERPVEAYPWYARGVLRLLSARGALSAPVRLWARSPRALLAFLGLFRALDREGSPLDPALRALVMARVSQQNRCAFCADLNGGRALDRGVTAEQLAALERHAESPLFDARARAALAFADAVTGGAPVPPELRRALRTAFTDDAIVELAALVAFQDMSSKFNAALDVPAEGRCEVPVLRRAPGEADP
jgi:AhpD family alkylhydroperoxidase